MPPEYAPLSSMRQGLRQLFLEWQTRTPLGRKMRRTRQFGFSLTELVVTIAVAMVLMGIAMPAFLRAYHSYQLTNAATQLTMMLRTARYDAIRFNKPVNCVVAPLTGDATATMVWSDVNGNNQQDPTEPMTVLGGGGNLIDPGTAPGIAALLGAAGITTGTTMVPPGNATIKFDARGSLNPATVNVFVLGSSQAPEAGFRAILLAPAGTTQMWIGDQTGNWQELH